MPTTNHKEYLVLPFSLSQYDQNALNCNLPFCFTWVWIFVYNSRARTQDKSSWEQCWGIYVCL